MPEALLLDSDILVDVGRALPEALDYLERAERSASLSISVVTHMELMVGCRSKVELRRLDRFLARFRIVQLSEGMSLTATDLLRRFGLSHGLHIPDALIAATAMTLGMPLASKNQRDYRFVAGLDLLPYP